MNLFYHPNIRAGRHELSEEESKHAIRVLRNKQGDVIFTTNGNGQAFKGTISDANPKRTVLEVELFEEQVAPSPSLSIAFAPTKNTERVEWFLEKAVELGVNRIIPIECQHSERKKSRIDRWERIMVSAMKQSLRYHLPVLEEMSSFEEVVERSASVRLIAHCYDQERLALKDGLKLGEDALILIGPEGDFSIEEVQNAEERGWTSISLGNRRLRTETAALSVVDAFYWFQNWKL